MIREPRRLSLAFAGLPLALAALYLLAEPSAHAGSCHAHAHSHDQCAWHTRSRTKSGSDVYCDASTNTPGVHSHAFSSADCNIFMCNKVVGGHAWWKNGCGPKHYWWHAQAGGTPFVVVGEAPTAEIEVLIPTQAPPQALPPPSGERPIADGFVLQGMVAAADAVVTMDAAIGIATADGEITHLMRGTATLGGSRSAAPGLRATGDLQRLLRTVAPTGDIARATIGREFVSRRLSVPTNTRLEFHFDLDVDVGGDDPEEGAVRDSTPPRGEHAASAASLAATLRLVDQSGAFALKDLEQEDDSGAGDSADRMPSRGGQ